MVLTVGATNLAYSMVATFASCSALIVRLPSIKSVQPQVFSLGSPANDARAMKRYKENQPEATGRR